VEEELPIALALQKPTVEIDVKNTIVPVTVAAMLQVCLVMPEKQNPELVKELVQDSILVLEMIRNRSLDNA
jgi:hypothetical protein